MLLEDASVFRFSSPIILFLAPLSPLFHPYECPRFFNFQKARWIILLSTVVLFVLLRRNTSPFLFCICILFFCGTRCGHIFYTLLPLQKPTSSLVVLQSGRSVRERRKGFVYAYRNDKKQPAYISAFGRASPVIGKGKAWHETSSSVF